MSISTRLLLASTILVVVAGCSGQFVRFNCLDLTIGVVTKVNCEIDFSGGEEAPEEVPDGQ